MEIEERLEKLKNAYAAGKVSKEIYEENLAKLEAESFASVCSFRRKTTR